MDRADPAAKPSTSSPISDATGGSSWAERAAGGGDPLCGRAVAAGAAQVHRADVRAIG